MRVLIAAFTLSLLAGCSIPSMTEMRTEGAAKTYTSAKKEDALSNCILFAWQDTSLKGGGNAVAYIQPGRLGGTTVYTRGNEYFADVQQRGARTDIQYYQVGNSWISKKLVASMRTCL